MTRYAYDLDHGNEIGITTSRPMARDWATAERQIVKGQACVGCRVEFSPTETIYRLFSGHSANSAKGVDKRGRCGTCARTAGVKSAREDHQRMTERMAEIERATYERDMDGEERIPVPDEIPNVAAAPDVWTPNDDDFLDPRELDPEYPTPEDMA